MSIALLPDIGNLDPNSLCYAIYSQLYHNFFNAQDKKSSETPYGIEEGDETSIRLHNTSYNFASAIAGAVNGGGSEGGVLLDYLKKSGGNMAGILCANYGFEAGMGNTRLLGTYREVAEDGVTPVYGLQAFGDIRIGGSNLFIGGKQLLRYIVSESIAYFENPIISFGASLLQSRGEMLFGENKDRGVSISSSSIYIQDKEVFHRGNANLPITDWAMKNAMVAGALTVAGKTVLKDELCTLYGVKLGWAGNEIISITSEVLVDGFLNISANYGLKIGSTPVLVRVNETDISLSCDYGNLLLGSENTQQIRLFAGLTDIDGDNILITKHGGAYFPDSFRASHNYGTDLLSTYRVNDSDEGVVIHKKLRFGFANGICLTGNRTQLILSRQENQAMTGFRESTSVFQLAESGSISLYIDTNSDFITFDKPVESKRHLGIDGSFTRLTDKHLYFSSDHYLMAATDGIKHFGNAYFIDSLGSERFSSGFAGYGWAILKNLTTGNIVATFDELTIRKKMRIYELEVQKNSATNGSLWVSDSCSGDSVEKIM